MSVPLPASGLLPGGFATTGRVAPVYIDGIPVANVSPGPSARAGPDQDFWSSQLRPAGDPTAEQLTVSLAQQRLISYIALDVAHFPHALSAWWWDGAAWHPLLGNSGAPLEIITTGSVPATVDNPAALGAGLNPYHYGAGHWDHHDEAVRPVLTSRLMLRLTRLARTAGHQQFPVSPAGKHVPYPLGVRNLDFGSRLLSRGDVPPTTRSPSSLTARQPFTTSSDVNGSPVQVAIRENRACDLLRGGTWKSAPQPHASSVVNLYLDSRDASGNPQLTDRFYLDPLTPGVRFSLYYSPVPPAPGPGFVFRALDDPIDPSLIAAAGTSVPELDGQGIIFPDAPGWLTLSAPASGTITSTPWWMAVEIMPGFGSSSAGTYVVADTGLMQLAFVAGTWQVTMPQPGAAPSSQPSGAVLGSWAVPFAAGDSLQFAVGYDGASFFAWFAPGTIYQSGAVLPVAPMPVIRLGGLQNPGASAVPHGNHRLTSLVLKLEQLDLSGGVPPDLLAFASGAGAYVSPDPGADQSATNNAIVRCHPRYFLGGTCPWGIVGGLGETYQVCSWIPVMRDYALARGYVEFDPVRAAAWKFEFTALAPEPFSFLQPTGQQASFFPAPMIPGPLERDPVTPAVLDAGLAVGQAIGPGIVFSDTPAQRAAPAPGTVLATEALHATDPVSAGQMAERGGGLYGFQPWQPPHVIPRWPPAQPHYYQQQEVKAVAKIAYFAALAGIQMFRLDYTAADDTEMYTDTFASSASIDPASLVPGGWSWQQGTGLVVPSSLSGAAQAQSVIFPSAHTVTGVQFASVQSDPVQLLADPDFSAPGFAGWGPVGDALPLAPAAVSAQLGNMVSVSRGPGSPQVLTPDPPGSWAYLQDTYATWGALMAASASWGSFGLAPAASNMGGIGYTAVPVATTQAGRLYAAARVFSPVALSAPLWLQLLDGASGAVIAEAEQAVAGGAVTEWFAGFTLGAVQVSTATWATDEATYPTWASIATAAPTWDQMDTTVYPLGTTVSVRLVQKTSTTDTWDVDNISVFEDAVVWEFSHDGGASWIPAFGIRNNPRGAVTFPAVPAGQGTQLRWRVSAYRPGVTVSALAIRPWYVTWPRGIVPRPAGIGHGPNMAPQDHYGPIESDPRWQVSSSPLPDSWYFRVRQALSITSPASDFPGPAPAPSGAGIRTGLVYEPPAVAALGEQTWADLYCDTYTDTYTLADGGDLYTDIFCDVYGQDYLVVTGVQQSAAASFAAPAILSADGLDVAPLSSQLGADLGLVAGNDASIPAWSAATGEPVPIRRIAFGNQIPAALAGSLVAADAGVRRVLIDIRPDATTTPGQMNTFLASCQAGGLQALVSIWAGAERTFENPQDFFALVQQYSSAIRMNGFPLVLTLGNDAICHNNALSAWYPGDDLVDIIAPTFWCTGPAPGSGGDTLATAASFAGSHGKPLGLAGFGTDLSRFTTAQAASFLRYVQEFFAARVAAGEADSDLVYLATGSYSLVGAPAQLITGYQQIAAAL